MNFRGLGRGDGGGGGSSGESMKMSGIMVGVFGDAGGEAERGETVISGETGLEGVDSLDGGEVGGISSMGMFSGVAGRDEDGGGEVVIVSGEISLDDREYADAGYSCTTSGISTGFDDVSGDSGAGSAPVGGEKSIVSSIKTPDTEWVKISVAQGVSECFEKKSVAFTTNHRKQSVFLRDE